ncbi:MAG: GT-D fold domain-containing glycosyltransferase [Syntrophomonas sp.]
MTPFCINDEDFADLPEITKRIRYCLLNKVGFSLVRIGDAENQVMAQGYIIPDNVIQKIWWAENEDWTGIRLPNFEARDRLIDSIKEADIVGVLHQSEAYVWKPLTEKIFTFCQIKPRQICYAFINVYFPDSLEFIKLLKKYGLLIIGKQGWQFASLLKNTFGIEPRGIISISSYNEIPLVLTKTEKIDFDLAIISAGSNAIILATAIARQGKVALDFGRAIHPQFWQKYSLHMHNPVNTYNVSQPLIHDNFPSD